MPFHQMKRTDTTHTTMMLSSASEQEEPSTVERGLFKCFLFTLLGATAVISMTYEKLLVDKVAAPIVMEKNVHVDDPVKPIKQISILGERHSGTRWTFTHLQDCFEHSLPVKRRLTRYKHWFQRNDTNGYPHDTIVIAQFRNPYDWMEAMRKEPHHSPAHLDLSWKKFCTKKWTTERVGADLEITNTENAKCQEKFHYKDIVSCHRKPLPNEAYDHKLRASENQPFYEMRNDGSGEPYANIMEMRADKIRNFVHDVKEFEGVRDVWVTKYEDLLADGTKGLLDRISKLTGVEYKCDPYKGQRRGRRPITKGFVNFLGENLDWEAEALAGYSKYSKEDNLGLNITR